MWRQECKYAAQVFHKVSVFSDVVAVEMCFVYYNVAFLAYAHNVIVHQPCEQALLHSATTYFLAATMWCFRLMHITQAHQYLLASPAHHIVGLAANSYNVVFLAYAHNADKRSKHVIYHNASHSE
jgi:hypothetical protein